MKLQLKKVQVTSSIQDRNAGLSDCARTRSTHTCARTRPFLNFTLEDSEGKDNLGMCTPPLEEFSNTFPPSSSNMDISMDHLPTDVSVSSSNMDIAMDHLPTDVSVSGGSISESYTSGNVDHFKSLVLSDDVFELESSASCSSSIDIKRLHRKPKR